MNCTILLIDDQPANLAILVEYLKNYNVEVVVSQNGTSGIERAGYVLPDLILLDVLMPDMDGFETCRQLKANDKTKSIPVIFMTALSAAEEKVIGFEVGGVDYVTKPLQLDEVWARIKTHLTISRLQREIEDTNKTLKKEIESRVKSEKEQDILIDKLTKALDEIKTLRGIIPICSSCKKVRDDTGYWNLLESYIESHSEASFSHGMCPECNDKLYGDNEWYISMKERKKKQTPPENS